MQLQRNEHLHKTPRGEATASSSQVLRLSSKKAERRGVNKITAAIVSFVAQVALPKPAFQAKAGDLRLSVQSKGRPWGGNVTAPAMACSSNYITTPARWGRRHNGCLIEGHYGIAV